MKPRFLFFPFTRMTADQQDAVLAFFPSVEYLPLLPEGMKEEINLDARIKPVFSNIEEIDAAEQAADNFHQWATMHSGNEKNLKSLFKETAYFTSDSDVSAIKSTLLKKEEIQDASNAPTAEQSLLFLKMTQLHDEQQNLINHELENLDDAKEKLFQALRGIEEKVLNDSLDSGSEKTAHAQETARDKDLGCLMTEERICAWFSYMTSKEEIDPTGDLPVFVTTSNAIFDYLESNCDSAGNPLDINWIKVHENKCENQTEWQAHLCDILMDAIHGEGIRELGLPSVEDECSIEGSIKLGLFSGEKINHLFNMAGRPVSVCLVDLKR